MVKYPGETALVDYSDNAAWLVWRGGGIQSGIFAGCLVHLSTKHINGWRGSSRQQIAFHREMTRQRTNHRRSTSDILHSGSTGAYERSEAHYKQLKSLDVEKDRPVPTSSSLSNFVLLSSIKPLAVGGRIQSRLLKYCRVTQGSALAHSSTSSFGSLSIPPWRSIFRKGNQIWQVSVAKARRRKTAPSSPVFCEQEVADPQQSLVLSLEYTTYRVEYVLPE